MSDENLLEVVEAITCYKCSNEITEGAEVIETHIYTWTSGVGWAPTEITLCEDCLRVCAECGEHYHSPYETGVSAEYCDNCCDNYYACDRCNGVYCNDDMHTVGYSDSQYCIRCIQRVATFCNNCNEYEYVDNDDSCRNSRSSDYVHNYGYKPNPVFYLGSGQTSTPTTLFMGMELEVEAKTGDYDEGAKLVAEEWGSFVYLKEDSSLNFGFEIVTHPATLEYYSEKVSWDTLNKLRSLGFRSWDTSTAGLHIHLSRSSFISRSHLLAFTYLINRNSELCQHIAGRNSSYGRIDNNARYDNNYVVKRQAGVGGERYNAINLRNRETVEIRMFKGSLKPERVRSALQFCHAAHSYSALIKSGSDAETMLRTESFTTWIRSQVKTYPDLVQYLPEMSIKSTITE